MLWYRTEQILSLSLSLNSQKSMFHLVFDISKQCSNWFTYQKKNQHGGNSKKTWTLLEGTRLD